MSKAPKLSEYQRDILAAMRRWFDQNPAPVKIGALVRLKANSGLLANPECDAVIIGATTECALDLDDDREYLSDRIWVYYVQPLLRDKDGDDWQDGKAEPEDILFVYSE
jgi:hypothetical protein